MTEYQFSITSTALEQIQKQLNKRGTPNAYLRLGVRGGKCSGFAYVIEYDDSEPSSSKDIVFNIEQIKVLIDKKSIIYLNNCSLDWEQSLMKSGFKFINPKEKSKCGCGESFEV